MAQTAQKPRVRVKAGSSGARPQPAAAYMRGEQLPVFQGWRPALRSASDDVRSAWRLATSRAVDMIQNSGWLAGGAEQSRAGVVGSGLTLNAKPDAQALAMTEDEASEWARRVERRYESWAQNPWSCDAEGRYTLSQLGAHAYDHWQATGEVLATFPFFQRPGSEFSTKVKILPAWQLIDRSVEPGLCQGVRMDATGTPISYLVNRRLPYGGIQEVDLVARDSAGRPITAHIFDGVPGQVRGITPFVSILKVSKQFDQLADATLTTSLIHAIFAATLKSTSLPEEVLESLQTGDEKQAQQLSQTKGRWYESVDINLGIGGRIAPLFPGDELDFLKSESPNDTYESFAKFLLRECSRAFALTYEEYTGDYAGATYSSIKMGTTVIWPRVLYRRKHIPARFHQYAYEAWLEEDIEADRTPFPGGIAGFLAHKDAATRAEWRGPAKPQADELKTAKAHQTWDAMGVISEEQICSDLGTDYDDVLEQRARAKSRRKALGLDDPNPITADPVGDGLVIQDDKKG